MPYSSYLPSVIRPHSFQLAVLFACLALGLRSPVTAGAEDEFLSSLLVTAARTALDKNDVTPALRWVQKEDESTVRTLFAQVQALREKAPEAKDLAENYFIQTVLRLNDIGLNAAAPRPQATPGPAAVEAGTALDRGSDDVLIKLLTDRVAVGVRKRFKGLRDKKRRADQSVDAGRDYVGAYAEFLHYVKRLYQDAANEALGPGGRE